MTDRHFASADFSASSGYVPLVAGGHGDEALVKYPALPVVDILDVGARVLELRRAQHAFKPSRVTLNRCASAFGELLDRQSSASRQSGLL
ncbi:hypothetical protein OKW45_006784 [Paraburkholderia sp. WSM4175]|uniref:hypothetical protein n=1 Tax=Paraburkholderia sp. WSM4175 TaxID=2991072 RepID=UPI003D1F69C5